MADWRELFSKTMLAKGEAYYKSGKAKKVQEEDEGGYSAVVRGSRNYKVCIETEEDDWDAITAMSCTCPQGREGRLCKHMAALLYLIEAEYYPMHVEEAVLERLRAEKKPEFGAPQGKTSSQGGSSGQGGRKKASSGPAESSSALPEQYAIMKSLAELRRQEQERLEQEQREEEEQASAEGAGAKMLPRHMEPYRYFRYEKFEDGLEIDLAKRKKANKLLESGAMKNISVQIGYPRRNPWDHDEGPSVLHGFVTARFDNGFEQARLVFDADHIVEASCSDWKCRGAFYEKRLGDPIKVCEHELALLELTKDYLEKNNPGDATSLGGRSLMGSADRGQLLLSDAEDFDAPAIRIEPVVDYSEDESSSIPTVTFRTGTSRLYKVKKISEYVDAMKAGKEMKFGTKTMIRLGEGLLDADAEPWYRFMQDALREEEQRNRALSANISGSRYYHNQGYEIGAQITDAIPLYGAALDKFYRVAEGRRIEFSIRSGANSVYGYRGERRKAELKFCDQELHVQIEISPVFSMQMAEEAGDGNGNGRGGASRRAVKKKPRKTAADTQDRAEGAGENRTDAGVYTQAGPLQGIRITGELPSLIEGQDASYFVDEEHGRFCRVDRARVEKIEPLLDAMENGKIDARIGRRNLRDFYNKMMPRLRESVDVVEYGREIIDAYLPPEPVFIFYFDIEEDLVLCRPDVHYGMQIHTILDLVSNAPWHGPVAGYRDQEKERYALEVLFKYMKGVEAELRVAYIERGDEEMLFNLLAYGLEDLMGLGEVRMTEAFRRLGLRRHMKFSLGVSVESNLMDLQILSEDLSEEELLSVFYQYQKKRKFVRLKNGDFLQLDKNETIERLLEIMETMGVTLKEFVRGKMQVPAYRALYLDKMLEQMQDVYTDRDRHFKALIKEFKTVEDADFEVPASLRGILRKYQVAGYRWLRTLDHYGFGGILADEMGLGKTLQVITVLLADKEARAALPDKEAGMQGQAALPDAAVQQAQAAEADRGAQTQTALPEGETQTAPPKKRRGRPPKKKKAEAVSAAGLQEPAAQLLSDPAAQPQVPATQVPAPAAAAFSATSLVVCPASLVYNWGEELHRFAPQLRAGLVTGTKKERALVIEDYRSYDVLATSYDLLKRDIDSYEGKTFRFEIIDEAQYIKNHLTAAAKSVKLIRARTRFALTGTPIENRLSELWSIFDYLMPGFLYTYPRFSADLEMPIVKFQDEAAAERLRRMASPFILRRRKEDVLRDLPEKLEEVRYAGMESKQRRLYDGQVVRMKSDMRGQSEADFRKSRIQILAELTKIRQICCDPSLILENYDGASAKRETCMELVRTVIEGEHKALIFSQFAAMLELLEADLKKEKIDYYKITGATPKEKRIEMVKAFNEDRTPVFLISLKAGGTGLNLTGADVVIHYDPWWNVAAQNQATDRAHRIGQTRIVTVYKLIVKDTIEERILEMQENKQKLAEDILSSESISSSAISREDLLELLG